MTGINNFGNTSLLVCLREQISPVVNNYIVLQPCLSADMLYDGGGAVLIASWGAVARLLHIAGGVAVGLTDRLPAASCYFTLWRGRRWGRCWLASQQAWLK